MNTSLSHASLQQLFIDARTHHEWLNKPIEDKTLRELYDLTVAGPTAFNALPGRIVFVKSDAAKEKLFPALAGSNVGQVKAASVTAIIAYDQKFFNHLPKLFPYYDAKPMFESNEAAAESTAFRNSTLQGGYFIIAARALGLDVGPMSGFDNAKVDELFFKGTSYKSNFLVNLGYGNHEKLSPRGHRFAFDDAAKIL